MENTPDVAPLISRPTNSQARLGANAMNRKSNPNPPKDSNSTGRRPNRSDSKPSTGPAKKLISPPNTANETFQSAAAAVSPPLNCFRRLGSTGTMMPIVTAQATALTKMNPNAARRRPDAGSAASVMARL